jgi:filamentous hemagglutinin family protein
MRGKFTFMKVQRCPAGYAMTPWLCQVRLVVGITIFGILLVLGWTPSARAQTPGSPITPSGLNTQISAPIAVGGQIQFNIIGGTRPDGGLNLFHSFGEFGVPTDNIANFLNDTGLPTSNILGRVTGGNPSSIFGTIQTEGFGNANLFLMNPAGILFGSNATLDVRGAVTFTTANYLRLGEGGVADAGIFHADSALANVLTSAPVAAFGFLSSNPTAISVQGSTLTVAPGQSISLVGGNSGFEYTDPDTGNTAPTSVPGGVTVAGGTLSASGGQINLVSVASPGEVLSSSFTSAPNINGAEFTDLGTVSLTEGTLVDVSAESAGSVKIRGGEFVIENSKVSADTGSTDAASIAIDINIIDAVSLSHADLPVLAARTSGTGNAGDILVTSGSLDATFSSSAGRETSGSESLIDSHTMGSGDAGNVTITTGPLTMNGDPFAPGYFIDSGTGGEGNGGNVNITTGDAHFTSGGINTGDNTFFGVGSGGNFTIRAESLLLEGISFATDSSNARAGALTFEISGLLHITENSFVSNISLLGENPITLKADHLIVEQNTRILSGTALNAGGDTNISARIVEFRVGGSISTQTFGDGDAGNIHLTAMESVHLLDDPFTTASGLFTTSFGTPEFGSHGNAGNITIDTPRLEMTNGARINSTTLTAGRGGDVIITASDSVSIAGERTFDVPEEMFSLGGTRASGIYTRTAGSELCAGTCGDAGHVNITTGSLTLQNGGLIDSGTTNNGQGGNITIGATGQVLLSGTMEDGTPSGISSRTIGTASNSGDGGNISLTAGQSVTMSDGASLSASSTGLGNAGNITAIAGDDFIMENSSITTQATQASGGNIKIGAADQILIRNSLISASVMGGGGSGGNISIDPTAVILQNSQILARAVLGNGGNITIVTPLFLADSTSFVSASSQFGLNGTVTIQSPTSNLSGSLGPLTAKPSQAQSLVTQRCAALANGQASSFVVAGREQLPADPGSWLSSPLYATGVGEGQGVRGKGLEGLSTNEGREADTQILSLRRLTPARFLIANFADSEATGCHS